MMQVKLIPITTYRVESVNCVYLGDFNKQDEWHGMTRFTSGDQTIIVESDRFFEMMGGLFGKDAESRMAEVVKCTAGVANILAHGKSSDGDNIQGVEIEEVAVPGSESVAEYPPANVEQISRFADAEQINRFAKDVRRTNLVQCVADPIAWQNGFNAGVDGLPASLCPQDESEISQKDWIRGWVKGSLELDSPF
jgi:ribosome modulation factor